jgi:hypothetical protein
VLPAGFLEPPRAKCEHGAAGTHLPEVRRARVRVHLHGDLRLRLRARLRQGTASLGSVAATGCILARQRWQARTLPAVQPLQAQGGDLSSHARVRSGLRHIPSVHYRHVSQFPHLVHSRQRVHDHGVGLQDAHEVGVDNVLACRAQEEHMKGYEEGRFRGDRVGTWTVLTRPDASSPFAAAYSSMFLKRSFWMRVWEQRRRGRTDA